MNILVVNCGSSSIKFTLCTMPSKDIIAKGIIEKLGVDGSYIEYSTINIEKEKIVTPIENHTKGVELILEKLLDEKKGCLKSVDEIDAVGHRIVHGGDKFSQSCLINDEVIAELKKAIPLAPLHNPANIMGIESITKVLPHVKQIGVFDTAFHHSIPAKAHVYPLPYELYTELGVRRYGFHGISHLYASRRAAELCNIDINDSKIISAHIGNGASITAVLNGKSVDTSMGLTPVEGLMMGTRCGDVDFGIINLLLEDENWRKEALGKYIKADEIRRIEEIEKTKGTSPEDIRAIVYSAALRYMMNKYSGLQAISGHQNSDMRDISKLRDEGNKRAELSLEMYNYRIKKYVGSYAAAMQGCDILLFTAGVGENKADMRKSVCEGLSFMGIELDDALNESSSRCDRIISKATSKVKVVVILTDEEGMIAKDTYDIVNNTTHNCSCKTL